MIDQGYSLAEAIEVFAKPDDRSAQHKVCADWKCENEKARASLDRLLKRGFFGPSRLDEEEWTAVNPGADPDVFNEWYAAFVARERAAHEKIVAEARAQWKVLDPWSLGHYSTADPVTSGLIEALRSGAAVTYGRMGGLQCPVTEIAPGVWKGDWQFEATSTAKGGVPYIEIFKVAIFLPDQSVDPMAQFKTGAPGRPSVIQDIDREAKRRRTADKAELGISAESRALHEWAKDYFPRATLPTARTIENKIRKPHNAWKKARERAAANAHN